jgi:hypothetical protein
MKSLQQQAAVKLLTKIYTVKRLHLPMVYHHGTKSLRRRKTVRYQMMIQTASQLICIQNPVKYHRQTAIGLQCLHDLSGTGEPTVSGLDFITTANILGHPTSVVVHFQCGLRSH